MRYVQWIIKLCTSVHDYIISSRWKVGGCMAKESRSNACRIIKDVVTTVRMYVRICT